MRITIVYEESDMVRIEQVTLAHDETLSDALDVLGVEWSAVWHVLEGECLMITSPWGGVKG